MSVNPYTIAEIIFYCCLALAAPIIVSRRK